MGLQRRAFLESLAAGSAVLAAGCTDGGGASHDGDSGGGTDSDASGEAGSPADAMLLLVPPSPSAGVVDAPSQPFTVTVTGAAEADVTVTPRDDANDGTFEPASVVVRADAPSATFRYTPASPGLRSISVSNDADLLDPEPVEYLVADASSDVVQFLTHDGDRVGNVPNSSAPTSLVWNLVLGLPWQRGVYGDWLDANGAPFGTTIDGAVPYASVALPAPGRYELDATALVQRWRDTGDNRGFYLRLRGNAFPVHFAGRTAASEADRPMLTVVTDQGTYELAARCNAMWATSSAQPISSSDAWILSDQTPAIVQFDLGVVEGNVTSATLAITDTAHDVGSTSAQGVVDVFEADPPRLVVPDVVSDPVEGIAAAYDAFGELASDPAVVFSDDFASPGWSDGGWDHPVERAVNPDSGTTYARGQFVAGVNGSANLRRDVSQGGVDGVPDVVFDELFGQYHMFLEGDFGSNVDSIKVPAMGVQFGYWNPVGYWQQTTGNGGSPGTGRKVWNGAQQSWEYQGHSVRFLVGQRPADASAYDGLFGIGIYPYNLDQQGPFPAGARFGNVVLRRERWYAIDIQVRQNSIVGPFDADGNGEAEPDGEYRVWINGYPAYEELTYRWRRHPEFGVQGLWVDFYHGGTQPAPYPMHYRIDRVTLATGYIGPLGG